jgi:hypothetical protein
VINIEFTRGPGITGKELNLLIEATMDRIAGIPQLDPNIKPGDCLPTGAMEGSLPGFRSIVIRAIQKSVSKIENRIKLALYPRRKTNFARDPKEVYENRIKFGSGGLDSFLTMGARDYPTWTDLNEEQKDKYNNNQDLYKNGTIPWDLLTTEQQSQFAREVLFFPDKVGDEERIDGKARSYIKLYERQVIKINKLALEIKDPSGLGIPYLNRTYSPNEYFLYRKEGAVILFPAQAKISATGSSNMIASSGYGLIVPNMPQIITCDYLFGLEEIPPDLQDAVAMLAAVKVFELVNVAFTKGMMSYSVGGFSASFSKGLYSSVIERYEKMVEELLGPYFQVVMTGY